MPVKQLLQILSAKDIEEWREFEKIEPFGYLAEELRIASLRADMSNLMRGKDDLVLNEYDFVLDHPNWDVIKEEIKSRRSAPKQSVEEMRQIVLEIHGMKGE